MTKNHAIMPPQSWATIVAFSRPEMIEIQKYLVLVSKKKNKTKNTQIKQLNIRCHRPLYNKFFMLLFY